MLGADPIGPRSHHHCEGQPPAPGSPLPWAAPLPHPGRPRSSTLEAVKWWAVTRRPVLDPALPQPECYRV